jgi:hypothetical protein
MDAATHRRLYIMGVVDGVFAARLESVRFFDDSTVKRLWLKQPPNARVSIDTAFALVLKPFAAANIDAVAETVTNLYGDPANSCLSWLTVVTIAIERLNGASTERLEGLLTSGRRHETEICRAR